MIKTSTRLFLFLAIFLMSTGARASTQADLPQSIEQGAAAVSGFFAPMETYSVQGNSSLDLIKSYLALRDSNWATDYQLVDNHGRIDTGVGFAGTVDYYSAIRDVELAASGLPKEEKSQIFYMLDYLYSSGAVFGFDGLRRNGCDQPTPYLLVLDARSGHVYGIALKPCSR